MPHQGSVKNYIYRRINTIHNTDQRVS